MTDTSLVMKNETLSSFSSSPSTRTVAIHSKWTTIYYIGLGDKVRVVSVSPADPTLTMAEARGSSGLEIKIDYRVSPAQARRHYHQIMSRNEEFNMGFRLDERALDREGIEYWMTYIKTHPESFSPRYFAMIFGAE